jgi:hypothetical protein
VHLSGQAQLALYRKDHTVYAQNITVRKTEGDKSGKWHIGKTMKYFSIVSYVLRLPHKTPDIENC